MDKIFILTEQSFAPQLLASTGKYEIKKMVNEKLFPNQTPFLQYAFVHEPDDNTGEVQKIIEAMYNIGFQSSRQWKYVGVTKHDLLSEVARMNQERFNVIVVASSKRVAKENIQKKLEHLGFVVEVLSFTHQPVLVS